MLPDNVGEGGRKRVAKLTPQQRSEVSRTAARAKWAAVGDISNTNRPRH